MKYRDLKQRIFNQKENSLIDIKNYSLYNYEKELNKKLINYLKYCIKKKIPLELNERDYTEIIDIYLSLKQNNLKGFLNELISISSSELNYLKVLELLKK